jgi:hypothetical protein
MRCSRSRYDFDARQWVGLGTSVRAAWRPVDGRQDADPGAHHGDATAVPRATEYQPKRTPQSTYEKTDHQHKLGCERPGRKLRQVRRKNERAHITPTHLCHTGSAEEQTR